MIIILSAFDFELLASYLNECVYRRERSTLFGQREREREREKRGNPMIQERKEIK
jgi:hypothetical protein